MAKVIDEKVKQIKEAIKKFGEETVDKIVTRKKENRIFYSQNKFEEWLNDNYKEFTKKELEILKFKNTKEATIEPQENTNQTALVISEKLKNEELGKKFLYFLDNIDEFIRIGEKAQNDLMIPKEIMEMKSFPTSVRISKEVLEKFNRFCDEHKNYSKMQLMNFALSEFVDRYTK